MPLFFLVSGYIYKRNHENIKNIIIKNVITFYIPYLFLGYSYWAERVVASKLLGIQLMQNGYSGGLSIFWNGDGLTWFLLSMLLVKIVFNILEIYVSDIFAFVVFSGLFWLSYLFPQYRLLGYLQWGIFFCLGYVMKKYHLEERTESTVYVCGINLFFIGMERYALCGLDSFVKIYIGLFVFVMFMKSKKVPHINFLARCGQNSMVIYIVHGLFQYFCYYLIFKLIPIKVSFVLLFFMILMQLLLAFFVTELFTKVKYLHWMMFMFYPYKYLTEKRHNLDKDF